MARWASFIDSKRSETPVLLLDTGNFCRSRHSKNDDLDYQYFFEGLKLMKYDAINVASNEIRYGRKRLLQIAKKNGLPLVSANIYDKRANGFLASPWIIKHLGGRRTIFGRKGGVRVGIFSVTLPSFIHKIDPIIPRYYDVRNPKIAALDAISRLREKGCDLIIAISHQGWGKSLDFAADVPGIDIVVNGRRSHEGTHYELVDSTLVVDTGIHRISFTEIEARYYKGKLFLKATDVGGAAHKSEERVDLKELELEYQKELKQRDMETE